MRVRIIRERLDVGEDRIIDVTDDGRCSYCGQPYDCEPCS